MRFSWTPRQTAIPSCIRTYTKPTTGRSIGVRRIVDIEISIAVSRTRLYIYHLNVILDQNEISSTHNTYTNLLPKV